MVYGWGNLIFFQSPSLFEKNCFHIWIRWWVIIIPPHRNFILFRHIWNPLSTTKKDPSFSWWLIYDKFVSWLYLVCRILVSSENENTIRLNGFLWHTDMIFSQTCLTKSIQNQGAQHHQTKGFLTHSLVPVLVMVMGCVIYYCYK